MNKVTVDLTMFEWRVRECLSKAVQQKMFNWGYNWFNDNGTKERTIDAGYITMSREHKNLLFSYDIVPDAVRLYDVESFLSLTKDPLEETIFKVGKPYIGTAGKDIVVCTKTGDDVYFYGFLLWHSFDYIKPSLWTEGKYSKSNFEPIDQSRIKIDVCIESNNAV